MSFSNTKASLAKDLEDIKSAGLWKTERHISSDQRNLITLEDGKQVTNMCANNYLGLANNQSVIKDRTTEPIRDDSTEHRRVSYNL